MSTWMKAHNFEKESKGLDLLEEQPVLAFEKDFLRWMLSDGAGAALLEEKPNKEGLSLRIDWIEMASFANQLQACMIAGGEKLENGEIKGWREFKTQERLERSVFSVKQDVKLLDRIIIRLGHQHLRDIVSRRQFDLDQISFFLPHISSEYFRFRIEADSRDQGVYIPQEKWFTNLDRLGNLGAASAYCLLEELFHSQKLERGQQILVAVPESARFSYGYSLMTVV
jgi:3-oxoacyl-[acyl-carrier-protein] synthase III